MDDGAVGASCETVTRRPEARTAQLSVSAAARADYIAELCAELEVMARGSGETVLATLFRMARAEAVRIAGQARVADG